MALDIVAWHDRTALDHQTQLVPAIAAGYRTISLCVYGDRNDPRYAASMVKRPVLVEERQMLGMDAASWQATFNAEAAQGWVPEIVTATGPANNPLFAACFVQSGSIPSVRHGMTAADFTGLNQTLMAAGNILRWVDVYGDPGNLRYVAVWVGNGDNRAWNCDGIDDNFAMTQQRFDALVTGFARPAHIATTPDLGYLVVYDDSTQPHWQQSHGMTSADYQAKFNAFYPQGLRPVRVSAKGVGANTRFGVIFAEQEDADPSTLRINGPANSPAVPEIDAAMEAVMTANRLHGASVAVVSGTRLVYTRGYTMGPPSYPDVQPTTFFRQASVSKMFTAAAIYQLIDEGATLPGTNTAFTLNTKLNDALPNIANGPPVSQWYDITIRHLLEMTSGVTTGILGTDPNVSPALPVDAWALARWLYRNPSQDKNGAFQHQLANLPGDVTNVVYSNAGYMLLGLVVARMRGANSYLGGLATFLNKLNMTRVRASVSVASAQAPDEARYHSRPLATASSVMVAGQPLCAYGYGEWNLENCGGGGGISAAATDVARVLAALSVTFENPMMSVNTLNTWMWNALNVDPVVKGDPGNRYHGFDDVFALDAANNRYQGDKGGSLTTSQNGVHFETGGISTVLCWNGMTPTGPNWFSPYTALTEAARAHDWGTTDLFPAFGMPSFPEPRRKPPRPLPPLPPRRVPMPAHMLPQAGMPKNM
jgi:CubicO group peptidase (beta-lactamase class C family)